MGKFKYSFNKRYKGFIIEELEYAEEKQVKTMKEMQEEFLNKNKIKKLEDGGSELRDKDRKSKSHLDNFFEEEIIKGKYHNTYFYDIKNRKIHIKHFETKNGKIYGKVLNKHSFGMINYYIVSRVEIPNSGIRLKESTIEEKIKNGIYTIKQKPSEPKSLKEDLDFYSDENFN